MHPRVLQTYLQITNEWKCFHEQILCFRPLCWKYSAIWFVFQKHLSLKMIGYDSFYQENRCSLFIWFLFKSSFESNSFLSCLISDRIFQLCLKTCLRIGFPLELRVVSLCGSSHRSDSSRVTYRLEFLDWWNQQQFCTGLRFFTLFCLSS